MISLSCIELTNSCKETICNCLAYFYAMEWLYWMVGLLKGKTMEGVLMTLAAVIRISLSLGMPNVTLAPPCPAKWKVFNVIWVLGSPTDCAAIGPTHSPGWINELKYFMLNKENSFLSFILASSKILASPFCCFIFSSFINSLIFL